MYKTSLLLFKELSHYQMAPDIKKHFNKNGFSFDKNDVIKAATTLQDNAEELPGIREQFRIDFIVNFVEGESIFSTDWKPFIA